MGLTRGVASLPDDRPDPRPQEDLADVALARQGDEQAFERLYRLNVARIRGLAGRLAGFDVADEMTQDVFVHAWQKLGSFRAESKFSTWLYRLATNLIVDRCRRGARRAAFFRDADDAVQNAPAGVTDGIVGMDLEIAVGRLPEGARQVFVLHDVEGYQHQEIGQLLGIAAGTSKGQLHRARMLLRAYLRGGRQQPPRGSNR